MSWGAVCHPGVQYSVLGCSMVSWGAVHHPGVQYSVLECRMVSWGAGWCPGVQDGVLGCRMVSWGAGWCPGVQDGVLGCMMVSWGAGWCPGVQDGVLGCMMVSWGAGWYPGVQYSVLGCPSILPPLLLSGPSLFYSPQPSNETLCANTRDGKGEGVWCWLSKSSHLLTGGVCTAEIRRPAGSSTKVSTHDCMTLQRLNSTSKVFVCQEDWSP